MAVGTITEHPIINIHNLYKKEKGPTPRVPVLIKTDRYIYGSTILLAEQTRSLV